MGSGIRDEEVDAVIVRTGLGVPIHLRTFRKADIEVHVLSGRDAAKMRQRARMIFTPTVETNVKEFVS